MYILSKFDILVETNRRNSMWEKFNKMPNVKLLNVKNSVLFPKVFAGLAERAKRVSLIKKKTFLRRKLFFSGICP